MYLQVTKIPKFNTKFYVCFLHYLTFLKVQVWIGNNILEPLHYWGWKLSDDLLLPITTELPPAPAELLKVI